MIQEYFVFKKEVDWSLLNQGISIPIDYQVVFKSRMPEIMQRGQKFNIKIIIDSEVYPVVLKNQIFNKKKYTNHKDVLQIRYAETSEISKSLKNKFKTSNEYIEEKKSSPLFIKKSGVKLPAELKEYFILYGTEFKDTFYGECITQNEKVEEMLTLSMLKEEDIEHSFNYDIMDSGARIEEQQRAVKIRRLNKAIGENLKILYDYKCQICGKNFSYNYGCQIVESHHIEYFIKSMNNDMKNIIVICPNHHSIIHKIDPKFDKKNLSFIYPNGLIERVKINIHL